MPTTTYNATQCRYQNVDPIETPHVWTSDLCVVAERIPCPFLPSLSSILGHKMRHALKLLTPRLLLILAVSCWLMHRFSMQSVSVPACTAVLSAHLATANNNGHWERLRYAMCSALFVDHCDFRRNKFALLNQYNQMNRCRPQLRHEARETHIRTSAPCLCPHRIKWCLQFSVDPSRQCSIVPFGFRI